VSATTGAALLARIESFTFHGDNRPVLRDIDFSATPGTLTAVLGGSGSGKTTLGKLLAGWLRAGHAGRLLGSLELGGELLEFRGGADDPRINPAAWSRSVGFVPQDAAAMLSSVSSTVAEELAFGLENRGMPQAQMRREVARAAAVTGLVRLLERDPATLSGGELRRLAVGCAVITEPEILVLDEPLASLDAAGAVQMDGLIQGLLDAGTAVVVLSQSADRLAGRAAQWVILESRSGAGTVAASGPPSRLAGSAWLERAGVVVPDETGLPDRSGPNISRRTGPGPRPGPGVAAVPLELRGVVFGYDPGRRGREEPGEQVLRGLDLMVRSGEIVAITGPNGAGKSTLLRQFNGLLRPSSGAVLVGGANIAGVPTGRVAASVGLLFQHPRDQLFERTALREVHFGLRELFGAEEGERRAHEALAAVGLAGAAGQHPLELAASHQRLLALATVLAREPDVLALDEPTVGLDRHGLERLRKANDSVTARGAAVVMVTHDHGYARANAHRILELDGGSLREI
jgi:energy-coupling factor transport system ATP-binding protein